ncbi:MAG: hypothetical protein J6X55_07820, partial [Victivallales bacterium]|nr:hypothetical protein [Victivallales bacterium]
MHNSFSHRILCIIAVFALSLGLSADEPKNLFTNGMFESTDGAFPAKWGDIQYRQKTVKALAVKKHAMLGGKDGIELPTIPEGNQQSAFVGIAQGIGLAELTAPRNAIIRIDMACHDLANGNVVAYANGKDNKLIYWKTIGHFSGNIGLRTYEFIAEIPAGAKYINVSFRNFGAGTLWLTNAQLYWEENAPKLSQTPVTDATLLLNPTMSGAEAGTLPKGWSRFFYPGKEAEGRIEIQNGECTLTHVGGAFGFGVESALLGNISPMRVYPIEAKYKTLDGAKFQISAEFRDAAGGTLGEQLSPLFESPVESIAKWQAKAPEDARSMSLRWLNADKGTVVFTAPACRMGEQIQDNAVKRFPISFRVFPAEWTCDWSNGKPKFYTFHNTEMPLSIELCGDRTKLKEPVVVIEFPDCLEVSCYSSYPTTPYYKDLPGEIVARENGRITLKLTNIPLWSILNKHFGAQRTVIANIRGPKASKSPHSMRIWAENNGRKGTVYELDIFLLDDPKAVELPKSFFIGRWSSMDSFPFKEEIFERMVEAQSLCGYRQATIPWGDNPHLLKYIDALREKGWTIACNHVDDHPSWKFLDYTQPKAIDPNGTPYANHVCPEQLIDNPHTHAQL